jgi:hypothetical protein
VEVIEEKKSVKKPPLLAKRVSRSWSLELALETEKNVQHWGVLSKTSLQLQTRYIRRLC